MKRETFIVGFTGQARCGKDTVVSILLDLLRHYNAFGQRVAFADALKQLYVGAHQYANIRNTFEEEWEQESARRAWRRRLEVALQNGGLNEIQSADEIDWLAAQLDWSGEVLRTPYSEDSLAKAIHRRNLISIGCHFRDVDPDFWVHQALASVDQRAHIVLIPDLRFANEGLACDLLVRVIRPETAIIYNVAHTEIDQSESFAMTGQYGWLIDNSSTIFDLTVEAKALLDELLVRRVAKMHTSGDN